MNLSYAICADYETIKLRQSVVGELTEKETVFYNLQAVLSKFLDVDHILAHCVQVCRSPTVKGAESNITTAICLKHVLVLVPNLQDTLKDCENPLLMEYCKVSKN